MTNGILSLSWKGQVTCSQVATHSASGPLLTDYGQQRSREDEMNSLSGVGLAKFFNSVLF
jgi:hypothetical protein